MVFQEIFKRRGIEITAAEAREPMGRAKRDHIAAITEMPRVAALWKTHYSRAVSDADVQAMYDDFLPLQKETLAGHSQMIPGVVEAIEMLRSRGIRIGSTTGYTRALMEVVAPIAAQQGYVPDAIVCADDVPAGRPAPWMNFLAAQQLGVYPLSSILVVDDTPVGIQAGVNSGAITVGITETGNSMGLSEPELAATDRATLSRRVAEIESGFRALGANHVVRSVAELPKLIESL